MGPLLTEHLQLLDTQSAWRKIFASGMVEVRLRRAPLLVGAGICAIALCGSWLYLGQLGRGPTQASGGGMETGSSIPPAGQSGADARSGEGDTEQGDSETDATGANEAGGQADEASAARARARRRARMIAAGGGYRTGVFGNGIRGAGTAESGAFGAVTAESGRLIGTLPQGRGASRATDRRGDRPAEAEDSSPDGQAPQGANDAPLLELPLKNDTLAADLTAPIDEQDVKRSDAADGMEFPENAVLEFEDASRFIKGETGTISVDVVPSWNGSDPGFDSNALVEVKTREMWQGRMALFRNGSYLRFVWFDDNGVETGVAVGITDWVAGERRRITATWGDALMAVYIDDQLAGQVTYSGQFSVPQGMPLFVGSSPINHVRGANATLSNFKVYGRALTAEEVAGE